MADLSIYRMLPQAPPPQRVQGPDEYVAAANEIAQQRQQQDLNRQRMAQNAVTLRSTTQEADEYARKTAEHNQIVDVLRKHDGDFEKATPEIMHINPIVGQQFAEQSRARKAAEAEAGKQMFATLAGHASDLLTANPVDKENDPEDARLGAAYKTRVAQLQALKVIPPGVLPPNATRQQLQGLLQEHQLTQQATAAKSAAETAHLGAQAAQATSEATLNTAKAQAEKLKVLAPGFANITNANDWNEALANLSEQDAALVGEYSPRNARRMGKLVPSDKIGTPHYVEGDKGKVTAVQLGADGAYKTVDLGNIGKTKPESTAGERVQSRYEQTQRENEFKAQRNVVQKGQAEINKHQTAISKLKGDQEKAASELKALGQTKPPGMKEKDWYAKIAAAHSRYDKAQTEIQSRMAQADDIKAGMNTAQANQDAVFGGGTIGSIGTTAPPPRAAPAPVAAPRATAPAQQQPPKSGGAGGPQAQISVKLPDVKLPDGTVRPGKYIVGTKAELEKYAAKAGLTLGQ